MEERLVHATEVVRLDDGVLVDEQAGDGGDGSEIVDAQPGAEADGDEGGQGEDVAGDGDPEGGANPDGGGDGVKPLGTVELEVFAGIEDVRTGDPEQDGG